MTPQQREAGARKLHEIITACDELWDEIDQAYWFDVFDETMKASGQETAP